MIHIGKRWLITLVLALLMTGFAATALAATGTVNVQALVLREEMSTKSDALQTLSKGDKVEIIYQDGSWYKVKYGRYTGFVMSRYVKTSGSVASRDEVESLRKGDKGDEVKEIQKRLKELGYLTGTADGVFGEKTEEAVKAFQKRNGLTADGVVGNATRTKLNSSSAKKAETATQSDETLRKGDKGDEVKKLQQRLKELGYYNTSIDGSYGDKTVTAVKAFQERNKLTVDGTAGPATQKVLYSSSAKKAAEEESSSSDTLRKGSSGQAVKTLQQKLKNLGYYNASIDGNYGDVTVAAVKAFQERNKLTVDGVAGAATLKIL